MTDKPEPTAEHIDAVARALFPTLWLTAHGAGRDSVSGTVAGLLTSTDPAVHAAQAANLPSSVLLAELVRRQVLGKEEHGTRASGEWVDLERYATVWRQT